MPTSRSSTSSSEPGTWQVSGLRSALATWLAALLLVAVAEALAWAALGSDDDWMFWRMSVGERIDLLRELPEAPDVLFVGDSTAASNFVPTAFDAVTGQTSFNLGTRGNMPMSWRETILDGVLTEIEPVDAIIVSFTWRAYYGHANVQRFEEGILGSPYARSLRGERVWGEWFHLARIPYVFKQLEPHQTPTPGLREERGWEPWEVTFAGNRPEAGTKTPTAPWGRSRRRPEKEPTGPDPERLDVVASVQEAFPEATVMVVIPPGPHRASARIAKGLRRRGVRVWDYSQARYPRGRGSHLRSKGARAYSRAIGLRWTRRMGG